MTASIDKMQDFAAFWNLEPETNQGNDTPFPDGSLESVYWPKYRELFLCISEHASAGDVDSVRWHYRTLELLMEQIQNLFMKMHNE